MTTPPLPPDVLERLRRIGLRIDATGRLWHQGDEVTHAGLRRALLRWLDVRADGQPIIKLDDVRYAYVDVDDTPLRITAVRWDGDRPIAHVDDDTAAPLDLPTLVVDADDRLRARVRDGRVAARLTSAAQQVLLERADVEGDAHGVRAAGRFWPLTATPPSGAA